MDTLPDELVREILTPLLYIDERTFESILGSSPFALLPRSSSDFLCVCKTWMRVATPLLFNTVILRSKAQAYALQRTLRANKDFGAFIRRLRVEGGYGGAMKTILSSAPKITHIWLTLDLPGNENTTGLCNSLNIINPQRVIIQDLSITRNSAPSRKLHAKLCDTFGVWTNLRYISLPWEGSFQYLTDFINRLVEAPSLETINLNEGAIYPHLHILTEVPALKLILVRRSRPPTYESLSLLEERAAVFTREPSQPPLRLQWDTKDYNAVSDTDSENIPMRLPLTSSCVMPTTPNKEQELVWSLILPHIVGVDNIHTSPLEVNVNRLKMSLVCKLFHRLVRPLIYTSPVVSSEKSIKKFAKQLAEEPLSRPLQSLYFIYYCGIYREDAETQQALRQIISLAPSLQCLSRVQIEFPPRTSYSLNNVLPLVWETFQALGENAGSSLVCLRAIALDSIRCPSIFTLFPALQTIDIYIRRKVAIDFDRVPKGALSNLSVLSLDAWHATCFQIFSYMDLDALECFYTSHLHSGMTSLLEKHGHKLRELKIVDIHSSSSNIPIVDYCPNLVVLELYPHPDSLEPGFFTCSTTHKFLEKILIEFNTQRTTITGIQKAQKVITNIDLSPFIALQEIQLPIGRWPETEQDILRDPWVVCTDSLLKSKAGIKVTNRSGKLWRTRLKYTNRTR